jgi:hydrogenase expression/formation protein HypC
MCLSIPAKILSIEGKTARASVGGTIINVGLHMIDEIKEGDYVLVHAGFALQKISDDEAQETLKLIREMENINQEQEKDDT